ncbi:hypothetical protein BV20DRAFT_1043982 [Pilatotrama ljubarskyi]|nr:hypothetical protein BV20DRAFT_1043982 [Pilatotrama ljubarskyi]
MANRIRRLCRNPALTWNSFTLWIDTVEIVDKNQYLLTPIRKRIFPKASPSVLRNLLSTPSLRACTPDQSILPEDSSLLGSPLRTLLISDAPDSLGPQLRVKGAHETSPDEYVTASPCPTSRFFLPSPPMSTELPSLESFRLPSSRTESSPVDCLDHHDTKRPEPSWDARRSSQGPRWPFSELIPSGLRAAPCSPLLTTRAVVHDSSTPLSSVPTARAKRASDPRTGQDRGLARGVVRDFQRVLDELQGLGHEGPASESDPMPSTLTHAPRPSPETGPRALGLQCGAPVGRPAADCASATSSSVRQPDWPEAPLGLLSSDIPRSGRSPAKPVDDRSLGHARIRDPPASTSFDSLEDEFTSLLLEQASEEETQAEQLRVVADQLDAVAKRKKRLAKAMTNRHM